MTLYKILFYLPSTSIFYWLALHPLFSRRNFAHWSLCREENRERPEKNPHSKDDKRKKARSLLIISTNKVLTILVKCIYHYLKNLIVNFKVVHLKEVLWKVRQLKEEHVLQKKSKQIGKRFNFLNFKFYTGYHADFCQYLHLSSPITPFYHNHKGNGTRKLYHSTTLQK